MSHTIVGISTRNPMWVYEENYRLLLRLLPEVPAVGEVLTFSSERTTSELSVRILEISRYTCTAELAKPFLVGHELLPDLRLKIRIYEDARVVEVVSYQGCERIPARYQVTGHGRFCRDEKRQVNFLLNDLLRHCLRYDYRPTADITRA